MKLGVVSFGDVDHRCGDQKVSHAVAIRNVVEQAVLADQVGIDFFGIGEHHRKDFAISSPEVVLSAIAAKTCNIRLGSAATVLSADDPVRVFQRFSTLNAISNGRAEVIVGRGWFAEAFSLFGCPLSNYDNLFSEKLELFARLLREPVVSWSGSVRPPLNSQQVYPPVEDGELRAWIAVGGTTVESVLRAAQYDFPMMIAFLSGPPSRYDPLIQLYRQAFQKMNKRAKALGVHSIGYVAETDEIARREFWPAYKTMRDQIGAERGLEPISSKQYHNEIEFGSLFVGSSHTVAGKIAHLQKTTGIERFDLKYSLGQLSHEMMKKCIFLYGKEVRPKIMSLRSPEG